jgi:hypothetical protein
MSAAAMETMVRYDMGPPACCPSRHYAKLLKPSTYRCSKESREQTEEIGQTRLSHGATYQITATHGKAPHLPPVLAELAELRYELAKRDTQDAFAQLPVRAKPTLMPEGSLATTEPADTARMSMRAWATSTEQYLEK